MAETTVVGYFKAEIARLEREIDKIKKKMTNIHNKEIETEMMEYGEREILPRPKNKERIW